MKKILRLPRIVLASLLLSISCNDDDKEIPPSLLEFEESLQQVVEGEDAIITLTLDKPAPRDGFVHFSVESDAIYGQHYATDPVVNERKMILRVRKGQTDATVKVTTVDDAKFEGTKFIIFQLTTADDGLRLGERTVLTLTIADDEGASLASFEKSSATTNEGDPNAILVRIPLSAPASGEGSVTVKVNSGHAILGTHFTIDQELTNDSFSINIVRNTTEVSFTVSTMDNDLFNGNFILSFLITDASGVVYKGARLKYNLHIVDNESPSVAEYASGVGELAETNSDGILVEVALSSPVKGEGEIKITLGNGNAEYGLDFTTEPSFVNNIMTLNLSHDQVSATFTVFPNNNDVFKRDLSRSFDIFQTSGVVWKASSNLSYGLTFVDDEKPSIANFTLTSASIDQISSEGMDVGIELSGPAAGIGQIIVSISGYNFNFVSDPVGEVTYSSSRSSGHSYPYYYFYNVTLDVPQYAEGASFRIFPLKDANYKCSIDGLTTFKIVGADGVVEMGDNTQFDLTIKADEPTLLTLNEKEGTLNENDAAGKEIILNFSEPSPIDGKIFISTSGDHIRRYTTIPTLDFGSGYYYYAILNFRKDDNSALFKVLPVNDNAPAKKVIETFSFELFQTNVEDGCLFVKDKSYHLTIVNDD